MDINHSEVENEDLVAMKRHFKRLKPFTCEIMVKPCKESFDNLSREMDNISTSTFDVALSNYVFVPFLVHIKILEKYKDDVQISLFKCLWKVLSKCELPSYEIFTQLFQAFNRNLSSAKDPTKFNFDGISEELTSSILSCLSQLLNSYNKDFDSKLKPFDQFDSKLSSSLGHSIYILLQPMSLHKSTRIRLKIMDILQYYADICSKSTHLSLKFYSFLPGIVCKLKETCSIKRSNYRKSVVLKSLQVLRACILCGIMDQEGASLIDFDNNFSSILKDINEELISYNEIQIRKGLLEFYIEVFSHFKGNLHQCSKIICNNLLIMNQDNDPYISSKSKEILVESGILPQLQQQLVNLDEIIELLNMANSTLKSNDDDKALLHIKRIISSLEFINFDFLDLRTVITHLRSLVNTQLSRRSLEIYSSISDSSIFTQNVKKMCHNIVKTVQVDDILDEFLPLLDNPSCDTEIIWIFNELLEGIYQNQQIKCSTNSRNLDLNELTSIASTYLSLLESIYNENSKQILPIPRHTSKNTIFNPILNPSSNSDQGSQVEKRGSIILNGIGLITQFAPSSILPLVVFTLVEFCGKSESSIVLCESAIQTLKILSKHLGFDDLGQFLSNNLDLIMSELSVKFLNISLYSNSSADALSFLANYFDFSQDQFVHLIERILMQSIDSFYGQDYHLIYIRIIYTFMNSLSNHHKNGENVDKSINDQGNELKLDLYNRLLLYQKSIGLDSEELLDIPEDNCPIDDPITQEAEEKVALSPQLTLALKLSHTSLNFLPSRDRGIQLHAMNSLIKGVELLRNSEDSLLPLAHIIWQNLVPRFSEADYVIVRKSFELLLVLCSTSRTFLKKRTLEEIFPKLAKILMNLSVESQKVKQKNTMLYTFSQPFKLQYTLLQGLGDLCSAIEVKEEDLDRVAEGCLTYLSPDQHKNLREAAVKLLKQLSECSNARSIWMKLIANDLVTVPSYPGIEFTPL